MAAVLTEQQELLVIRAFLGTDPWDDPGFEDDIGELLDALGATHDTSPATCKVCRALSLTTGA